MMSSGNGTNHKGGGGDSWMFEAADMAVVTSAPASGSRGVESVGGDLGRLQVFADDSARFADALEAELRLAFVHLSGLTQAAEKILRGVRLMPPDIRRSNSVAIATAPAAASAVDSAANLFRSIRIIDANGAVIVDGAAAERAARDPNNV